MCNEQEKGGAQEEFEGHSNVIVAHLVHTEFKFLEVFAAFIKVTSQDKLLMEAEEAQNRVILRRWARSKHVCHTVSTCKSSGCAHGGHMLVTRRSHVSHREAT